MKRHIAIVGRPNVGKSTLFNKLIGKRLSIVKDVPGVTRDRVYHECSWRGQDFMLVDTGGIEWGTQDILLAQMYSQALTAIETSDVIVMVTDLTAGVTANDIEIATFLKKSGRPVILCVNKCDRVGKEYPLEFYEFYSLGLGDPVAVSSVHGHGTGDLLDACFEYLDFTEHEEADERINVAIIGKPNAGKSSLINRLAGTQRSIVSDIAGTTRDSIDSLIDNEYGSFRFIDTAGIRRKSRIDDDVEHYSVLRAYMAVERCDVAVVMIDATMGYTEQDSKIAGLAESRGKCTIIAVNKWDAVEKTDKTQQQLEKKLEQDLGFISYAPKVFISALTGQRIDRLYKSILEVHRQAGARLTTGRLNEMLAFATARVQPPSDKGKRLKIYYATQTGTYPPTFVFFCNDEELFHFSYRRYLENRIRESFGLDKVPINIVVRERNSDNENIK